MKKRILMAAYGANTNLDAMADRCPAAIPLGAGLIASQQLIFRGVADVIPGPAPLHVALWAITARCEIALDRYEGFPRLYEKQWLSVTIEAIQADAMVYVMTGPRQRALAPPDRYYLRTLLDGYRDFDLPVAQIQTALNAAWAAARPVRVLQDYQRVR